VTGPAHHRDPAKNLSQRDHRRLIGVLGLFLPAMLIVVAGLRPTTGLPPWELLSSVSEYYYTGAVGILVGILFALSLFLFTYGGYEGVVADRVVGWISGAAAVGVSVFPTSPPHTLSAPSWWRYASSVVHHISAIVLFVAFIIFAIWLFRKSSVPRREDRPVDKRRRDDICLVCGLVMIACVLWAGSSMFTMAPIFWPEVIAILAFAISWLVKGEAYEPIIRAVRRLSGR